jgi:hypothetical protein
MYQGAIVANMFWLYPLSGFVDGAIVGLTGMGGGALESVIGPDAEAAVAGQRGGLQG